MEHVLKEFLAGQVAGHYKENPITAGIYRTKVISAAGTKGMVEALPLSNAIYAMTQMKL